MTDFREEDGVAMRSHEAPIIDLDAFRRRRQPVAVPPPGQGPAAQVMWVPVWLWVPMYCLPIS
jgi:hypothetical protein